MSGRVYLVGAGPGDPGLLTLRGQRCLAAADVVVHDDLVSRRLLEHARPDAEVIAVGGAHGDPARLDQAEIERLLVARAGTGKTVVRLKNGDPFLFGRGAAAAEPPRRAGGLGPPAVIVVGSAVGVRERVRWFEERPLFGRRVVVTRPRAQAGELARLLEDVGAEVILFPTIAIAPPRDPEALERAVARAAQYDWVVFTSPNGVRVFFETFARQERDVRELARVRLAAIGPRTAAG